ncbi:MAG: DUF3795 domain-containing protein [Clostridiales bacterium]|nr:DUF3795 domain-containing protein [Clostridiales bacterium]
MDMPLTISDVMFAPCGMNCMVCYKHCLTKKVKKPCGGCLTSDIGKPKHCQTCEIKNCLKGKAFTYCYKCEEFPCGQIKRLEKSYQKNYSVSLIENSLYVKQYGIAAFMNNQRSKYLCDRCGGIISLHDKVCSECGV